MIITFGPDGVSGHADHVTISHIVTQAYDQYYRKGLLLFISPSEATALGCGVTSIATKEDNPQIKIDISDFRLSKVKAIRCHASQNPGLEGNITEEAEKLPCFEIYTIARTMGGGNGSLEWFFAETEKI